MDTPEIIIIVAANNKKAIGLNQDLPWKKLSLDFKRFKDKTMGHPMIMGRKTFQTFQKPLPGRKDIVISNILPLSSSEEVEVVRSFEGAIAYAKTLNPEKIFIIGGERVFKDGLDVAHKILLTQVFSDEDGDAFLPEIDNSDWRVTDYENHENEPGHSANFAFVDLVRR